jgi:hypothetical protein
MRICLLASLPPILFTPFRCWSFEPRMTVHDEKYSVRGAGATSRLFAGGTGGNPSKNSGWLLLVTQSSYLIRFSTPGVFATRDLVPEE